MPVDELRAAEILLENARYEYDHAERWFEALDQKAHNLSGYVSLMVGFVGGIAALLSGLVSPHAGGAWTGLFMLPCLASLWWTWTLAVRTTRLAPSALPPPTDALAQHALHPSATEATALLALARGTSTAVRVEVEACEGKAQLISQGHEWLGVSLIAFAAGFLCALIPVLEAAGRQASH